MKKTVLFSIGVLSVLFVSCRQNDNILSNEDVTTLKIIQKNRNIRDTASVKTFSIDTQSSLSEFDDVVKPPK
ncbi:MULTISPECIES: hypothetical protein [Cloacibacterium]|jgi:hypothetical protein|uniref:Lipoprotein n=2 Tax=root TaxID=1 RepID=A0A644SP51_9ZZZZ|nr:hypothetical protein [Cloacibacterium normanense]AZI69341.1 hypothetical protein EB819_05365 [Cloacibacterium normanense]OEL10910.1 putative lipoprotein [Cloacibacterium normanense]SDO47122.1 hypothetical protein SAMN04489756_107107 [Cloacibacterium normanense]